MKDQPGGARAPSAMAGASAAATATALTVTLGLAAASWVAAVRLMNGMDMGVATQLGSFGFFATVAGTVVIAAGLYELTALKRHFRRRCREGADPGWEFGLCCVGSSAGLMLALVALGLMSVTWMSVIAVLVLAQKLLPAHAAVDVPLALAIAGLGILIVCAPSWVPGLVPSM